MLHLAEHNTAEAVRQLAAFRRLIRSEIGVDASVELRRLVARATRPTLGEELLGAARRSASGNAPVTFREV